MFLAIKTVTCNNCKQFDINNSSIKTLVVSCKYEQSPDHQTLGKIHFVHIILASVQCNIYIYVTYNNYYNNNSCSAVSLLCQIKQLKMSDVHKFKLRGIIRPDKRSVEYLLPKSIRVRPSLKNCWFFSCMTQGFITW